MQTTFVPTPHQNDGFDKAPVIVVALPALYDGRQRDRRGGGSLLLID